MKPNLNMQSETPSLTSRRQFTVRSIYGLAGLMSLAMATPAAIYVFGTPGQKRESGWIDAGAVSVLPFNEPTEVPIVRIRTDGWKIRSERDSAWVLKKTDGRIVAFSPRCTHLGCAYHWDASKQMFACPCHGSLFSPEGSVIAGPAPRPLDQYLVRIDGDRLWLGQPNQSSSPSRDRHA